MTLDQLGFQKSPEIGGGDRIQTACRFVEQQHAGTVNHGPRQAETMYLAGGKGPHLAVDEGAHPHQFNQFFETPVCFSVEQIIHSGEEVKIFAGGQAIVEAAVRGGVKSKLGADLRAMTFHVVSGDPGAATGRHQQSSQDAQQSRFPRTVGADESSYFAGFDLERNSQQGRMGKRRKRIEKRPHSGLRHRKILHDVLNRKSAGGHTLSYTRVYDGGSPMGRRRKSQELCTSLGDRTNRPSLQTSHRLFVFGVSLTM